MPPWVVHAAIVDDKFPGELKGACSPPILPHDVYEPRPAHVDVVEWRVHVGPAPRLRSADTAIASRMGDTSPRGSCHSGVSSPGTAASEARVT